MSTPGKKWRHVIINTRASWHHGDSRGFRSREHRIHSSGDYRNRPPAGEHAGLLRYRKEQSGKEVHVAKDLRPVIGRSLLKQLNAEGHEVLCAAVGNVHTHLLVELQDNIIKVKAIVGNAKRVSSREVKKDLPGSVWAAGGTFKPIKDRGHQLAAFEYILYDQGPDAWTWSIRDKSTEGRFDRPRPPKKPSNPPRRGIA